MKRNNFLLKSIRSLRMMQRIRILIIWGLFNLGISDLVYSQNAGTITGTVLSEVNGSPLIGVNVILEGTRFGTTTDTEGTFTIANVPAGRYQLQFSFIGYEQKTSTAEVNPGTVTSIEIALSGQSTEMKEIIVEGRAVNLIGVSESASQGRVGRAELASRPLLRTGEVMETVPGLIATQHSGSGKANQFFLRGFNLDHGTDFLHP